MVKKVYEINLNGERIFLRKTFLGWATINPVNKVLKGNNLEPLDKKTNLKNLLIGGSWIKLGIVVFVILVVLGSLWEYRHAVGLFNQCQDQLRILKGIGGVLWNN